MTETFILQLFITCLLGIFGFYGLRLVLFLKTQDKLARQVHGHITEISKLKGQLKQLSNQEVAAPANITADLSNLTIEQVAAEFGFEKELNNPIFRPIAEKIFAQIKDKAAAGEQTDGKIFR